MSRIIAASLVLVALSVVAAQAQDAATSDITMDAPKITAVGTKCRAIASKL